MMMTLQVDLNHPDGRRAYARDLEWALALPGVGDVVALGAGLGQLPVRGRVFDPSGERVVLIFEPATSAVGWADALDDAGWSLLAEAAPSPSPTPDAVTPVAGHVVV